MSRIFPVQNSTLSAEAIGSMVAGRYSLPGPPICELFRKGICDTYRVRAADREYYLKVSMYGRRSRKDVLEEVRLLRHLVRHGAGVVTPVRRNDGRYVSSLRAPEGPRFAVLYEAVEGVEISSDAHRRALGETVARFHACSDLMRQPYDRAPLDMKYLIDDNLAAIGPHMAHRRPELDLIRSLGEQATARVTRLLPTTPPEYGVCHGDLHGGDARCRPDGSAVIFDFDSSGCGWRALDVGVYLTQDWMNVSAEAEAKRQRGLELFLEGYTSVRRLSDEELDVAQWGPPVHHIYLMGFVLRYTTVREGNHWANDAFISWHMEWFRDWASRHPS